MATRINAHEERLATLNSIMNVIAVLDMGAPRRSVSDRWIDLRALMPEVEPESEDSWSQFITLPGSVVTGTDQAGKGTPVGRSSG